MENTKLTIAEAVTYKLVGVTEFAERHLTVDDVEKLKFMIGSKVSQHHTKHPDGTNFIMMPDMETCHKDFLILEPLSQITPASEPPTSKDNLQVETPAVESIEQCRCGEFKPTCPTHGNATPTPQVESVEQSAIKYAKKQIETSDMGDYDLYSLREDCAKYYMDGYNAALQSQPNTSALEEENEKLKHALGGLIGWAAHLPKAADAEIKFAIDVFKPTK